MSKLDFELSEKDYNAVKNLPHHEVWLYMDNSATSPLGMAILCGYGLYGVGKPYEKDGKYFIPIEIGSTCD